MHFLLKRQHSISSINELSKATPVLSKRIKNVAITKTTNITETPCAYKKKSVRSRCHGHNIEYLRRCT